MKKILVPCDFSESARQAYKFAIDIAAANAGEIIVASIIDLTPVFVESLDSNPYYLHITSIEKELEDNARKNFEKLSKSVDSKNVKVSFVTDHGIVCQTLLNQIHKTKCRSCCHGYTRRPWVKRISHRIQHRKNCSVRACPCICHSP